MEIERIKTLLGEHHDLRSFALKMGKSSVVYKTITIGNPMKKFLLKLNEALNLPLDIIVNTPAL